VNDIVEKGVTSVTNQSFQGNFPDQVKEKFVMVSSQMVSYKEFAEKMNWFQYDLELFHKSTSLNELIHSVNRLLPAIFCCEIVRLWLVDGMNGTIYTQ
jgi:hypothetical protein